MQCKYYQERIHLLQKISLCHVHVSHTERLLTFPFSALSLKNRNSLSNTVIVCSNITGVHQI